MRPATCRWHKRACRVDSESGLAQAGASSPPERRTATRGSKRRNTDSSASKVYPIRVVREAVEACVCVLLFTCNSVDCRREYSALNREHRDPILCEVDFFPQGNYLVKLVSARTSGEYFPVLCSYPFSTFAVPNQRWLPTGVQCAADGYPLRGL